jgi:hypothetical protein
MTNLEFVSEITGILKSNNKDNKIPRRLILKIGQDATAFLVAQKLLDRTISSEVNLYTTIPCFEFEQIDAKKCPSLEFRMCKTLMKSVKPLPKLVFSRLGASIRDVVSLDGDFTFSFVDETQYRRNKKRPQQLKNQIFVYLGTDNHLYIPDREIHSLDLTVLTLDTTNIEDCSSCLEKDECTSNWDAEFICPSRLIEATKDMTIQRLILSKQIQSDQNPNGIQGN